jgi:phospholipase A1/A2
MKPLPSFRLLILLAAALPACASVTRVDTGVDRGVDRGVETGEGESSSLLSEVWELDPEHERGVLRFTTHKDTYVLPVKWSADVNTRPTSPGAPGNSVPVGGEIPYRETEAMFQLSFKTKLWQDVIGDWSDLWLGYTQQSYWQVFTSRDYGPEGDLDFSRPFRETNYQPELLLVARTDYEVPLIGMKARFLAPGIEHQSNGRAEPLSRSWNRVYLIAALERGPFVVMIKPWLRLDEDPEDDDNPQIEDYLGRAQIDAYRSFGEQGSLHLRLRTTYRTDPSWGSAQLTWRYPLPRGLTLFTQLFHGHGESMVDYNFRNTVLGIGLSIGSPF